MVSQEFLPNIPYSLSTYLDYCCYSNPQDYGQISFNRPSRMVRLGIFPRFGCLSVNMGQSLQILSIKIGFPPYHCHIRDRKPDMWYEKWIIGILIALTTKLGVAQNSTTLIVGRAVAGIGGAGIASGIYTIIAFTAKPNQRPAFTGILGAVYGVASVIGPLLGGLLTDNLSWRWCFYINLPIGGASAAIILIFFRTPRAATPMKAELKEKFLQMDFLGTLTIMAAGICYVLAMQWGGVTKAWNSPAVVGTLVGFGLIVSAFVVLEWRLCERAMILFRLLRVQTIATGSVFAFFLFGAFFTLMYYVPLYFQAVSGVSAAQSGIRNLPLVLAVSIFTILSGALITMFGYFMPFLVGGAALTTIGSGLLFTMDSGSNPAQWIGYQALAGIGIGLSIQVPIICAQAVVAPSDISSATAMILCKHSIYSCLKQCLC